MNIYENLCFWFNQIDEKGSKSVYFETFYLSPWKKKLILVLIELE